MDRSDDAARELGLSRSGLIAEALRSYLENRQGEKITEGLNRSNANEPGLSEAFIVRKLRTRMPIVDRW